MAAKFLDSGTCRFAGPFLGKMYLVLIDAYSKWMEVHITSGATSAITTNKMKMTFSSLGLPQILVTDNGPAFSSQEFATFIKANGMKHVTSIPYHPASNGLAEKPIQTFKATMKKLTKGSLKRITPQSTTGQSPSDLLFGRRLRSHLDLLHPNLNARFVLNRMHKSTHMTTIPKIATLNMMILFLPKIIDEVHHGFQE